MARGGENGGAPAWAWAVMAVCVVAIAVMAPIAFDRGEPPGFQAQAGDDTATTEPPAVVEPLVVERAEGEPLRVLFTGDSLTSGYYASSVDLSFRSLMVTALGPVEETTAERADQTLTTVSSITEVPADLDLAVVELGTNDVGQATPLDDFAATYVGLLERIRAVSPGAAILCAGTWVDDPGQYDAAIQTACESAGGRFVPLAPIFDTAGTRGPEGIETARGVSDDFHPNDAGHQAIAAALLAAVSVTG